MKKIFSLLLIACTLVSCTDNDDSLSVNPNLLQKVVFFSGQSNEAHWYFNSEGLLSEIKSPDGTLREIFTYDSHNNVINDTKFGNGAGVFDITYSENNIITQINGQPCNYDTTTSSYSFVLDGSTTVCKMNDEMLATKNTTTNSISHVFVVEMLYQDKNMTSYDYTVDGGPSSEHRIFDHGNMINPLKSATLPVFKLKSLIDPSFFVEGTSSRTVVEGVTFGDANPYYFNYGFLIYPSGKLEQQDREIFNGSELEFFYSFAKYYYQGDVLP